jgi:hypothetical protein
VLVDDYQDTTFAAEAILRGLARRTWSSRPTPPRTSSRSRGRPACLLGPLRDRDVPGAERIELASTRHDRGRAVR